MDTPKPLPPLQLGWRAPLAQSVVKLLLLLLAGCVLAARLEAVVPLRSQRVGILLGAVLVAAAAVRWGGLLRLLTSLPFALAQIGTLALAAAAAVAVERWPALGGPLGWAARPFDRCGIQALLALLAVSALAVAWQRRPYRPARLGFLLVHLAPCVLALGAFWNGLGGHRTVLEVAPGGEVALPSGHRLRLLDLEIAGRPHALHIYRRPAGRDHLDPEPQVVEARAGSRQALADPRCELEVLEVLADALLERRFREDPAAAEDPALFLMLGIGVEPAPRGYLFSRRPGLDRQLEPGGRFAFQFREGWNDSILKEPPAESGYGLLRVLSDGRAEERRVRPDLIWELPGWKLAVLAEYPDFAVRPGGAGGPEPYSRSRLPKEPWLALDLVPAQGQPRRLLLSANDPKKSDALNAPWLPPGLRLEYRWERSAPRQVVFTRADRTVRLLEHGRVVRRAPLVPGQPFIVEPGLSLLPLELIVHPVEDPLFMAPPDGSEPARPPNPALKVRIRRGDGTEESRWLEARGPEGEPTRAMALEGRLGLVFRRQDPRPGDLRARLALLDATGRELTRSWASVDSPLVHQDLRHRPTGLLSAAPGCALESVREPGRRLVLAGWLQLLLGMAWMFYLKPVLKRKERGGTP